jgi:hypothetical protein
MNLRRFTLACLWFTMAMGILALPAAIIIGSEDGPMPADQLWHRKRVATSILLVGGAAVALSVCGLYVAGRAEERS